MIITSIETFLLSVPTASGSEFAAIKPFVDSADSEIQTMLTGTALYDYIAAHNTSALYDALRNLIAFTAYKNAIPFVDLIQTANGFAVVSNNNLAPASKERVERLIVNCNEIVDRTTDKLITLTIRTGEALTEWAKASCFQPLTNCMFLTGSDYGLYGRTSLRSGFVAEKGTLINLQQSLLVPVISQNYFNALISSIRSNSLTVKDSVIVNLCKQILCAAVNPLGENVQMLCGQLSNILDSDLTSYPTYAQSPEYALKSGTKYVNKSTDSTFFFGV